MRTFTFKDFYFVNKDPKTRERQPREGMTDKELISIDKYPYIVLENTNFVIKLQLNSGKIRELKGVIPKGFCYNMADIPGIFQYISFDKHSPFVRSASLIHDYLLANKFKLYSKWNLADLDISFSDFRYITSEVFRKELEASGVKPDKAKAMANAVDLWQRLVFGFKVDRYDDRA